MRHKDYNWNLPEGEKSNSGSRTHQWESIHAALLMDIRDELKLVLTALEPLHVLKCSNFLDIPRRLELIRQNTKKKRRKAPKAA